MNVGVIYLDNYPIKSKIVCVPITTYLCSKPFRMTSDDCLYDRCKREPERGILFKLVPNKDSDGFSVIIKPV